MNNFNVCKNGHHYQDIYPECPYCPKPQSMQTSGMPQNDTGGSPNEKTQVFQQPATGGPEADASGATRIMNGPLPQTSGHAAGVGPAAQGGRKLVGWLVTFDKQPAGRDYRLYEGRNVLGSNPGCEVRIDFDEGVSGRHLTILYRLGEFLFKDELSTNGTFLNGAMTNEGALKDGDQLRTGNTTFLFRSALS